MHNKCVSNFFKVHEKYNGYIHKDDASSHHKTGKYLLVAHACICIRDEAEKVRNDFWRGEKWKGLLNEKKNAPVVVCIIEREMILEIWELAKVQKMEKTEEGVELSNRVLQFCMLFWQESMW